MAIRIVREVPDEILNKKTREVKDINDKIRNLLDDMVDTMRKEEGIGLAGPQVGVLRRLFVVEVDEGEVLKVINPEILETKGTSIGIEGCLSIPNWRATVERPEWVKMRYQDENGEEKIIEADGLLGKCLQHEFDHLEGILISSKYIEEVTEENMDEIVEKYNLGEESE